MWKVLNGQLIKMEEYTLIWKFTKLCGTIVLLRHIENAHTHFRDEYIRKPVLFSVKHVLYRLRHDDCGLQ